MFPAPELLPEAVLARVRARGVRVAEVLVEQAEVLWREGLRGPERTEPSVRWVVRLWLEGGRRGRGESAAPDDAIDAALARAREAEEDPHGGPADIVASRGAQGIEDPRYGSIVEADRAEIVASTDRALGRHRRRLLQYVESRTTRRWCSSRGPALEEVGTRFGLDVAVDGPFGVVQERVTSRRFADVASRPLGLEVRRRADALVREVPDPGALPVLLEPRVMAGLLDAVARAFALRPVSGWLSSSSPAEPFALLDDGALRNGLRTRGFDAAGVPPRPVALANAGRWGAGYRSPEEARRDVRGMATGHAWGEGLAPSNLVMRPGARSRNVMLLAHPQVLVLDALPELDIVSGAVVGEARFVLLEDGVRVGAVARHVQTSLARLVAGLVEVGSDEERHGHVDACTGVFLHDAFGG